MEPFRNSRWALPAAISRSPQRQRPLRVFRPFGSRGTPWFDSRPGRKRDMRRRAFLCFVGLLLSSAPPASKAQQAQRAEAPYGYVVWVSNRSSNVPPWVIAVTRDRAEAQRACDGANSYHKFRSYIKEASTKAEFDKGQKQYQAMMERLAQNLRASILKTPSRPTGGLVGSTWSAPPGQQMVLKFKANGVVTWGAYGSTESGSWWVTGNSITMVFSGHKLTGTVSGDRMSGMAYSSSRRYDPFKWTVARNQ